MGSFPLDASVQDALLCEAQQDPTGPAMTQLLRRYEPLVQRIARGLTCCPLTRDDLANEARIAFTKAVNRHRLGRHGFPAYAERYMSGAARRWLRTWNARSDDPLPENHEPVAVVSPDDCWGDGSVAAIVAALPSLQRHLLTCRYVLDVRLVDLAGRLGTSESAVSQRLRTAERIVERRLTAA